MELVEIFETLVKTPSPSLEEEKAADKIIEILTPKGIDVKKDNYGNVIGRVEATDKNKKPLMFSAHMDVVGDDTIPCIVYKDGFIETDKKRTLGADDKSGVSIIMKLAMSLKDKLFIPHGGMEFVFTKDEEFSMTGIENLEFEQLEAEDILVLDSDKLGNFEISGAGYTKMTLSVYAPKGGHSGLDIGDKTRLNAAKLTAELVDKIPQGVYRENELGVITSINLGSIVAGGVDNSIFMAAEKKIPRPDAAEFVCHKSMSNIINTKGYAHYSIRSSDKEFENELIGEISNIIKEFNKKYEGLAKAEIKVEEHLPIFNKSDDNKTIETAKEAAKKANIEVKISSFHAGAETHIYANKKNKNNVTFRPVLVGIADIYGMHSSDEKMNIESFKKGYNFIEEFFIEYNK